MIRVHTLRKRERGLRLGAAMVAACLLAACAGTPAPQTIAERRNGDGIGGTGAPHNAMVADGKKNGDGIGGTGILGTISGFGSIIVNGAAWEFDRATAVATDGKPASLEALRVGQVIKGVARLRGDTYYLDTLDIQHAVSGPISAIDHAGETMTVLGQKVKLNLAGDKDATDAFRTLQAGDVVRISGLRLDDGTIIASRVDGGAKEDGRVLLRGLAGEIGTTHVKIGDLTVSTAPDTTVSAPTAGGQVFASGRMINGQFVADVVVGAGPLPFGKDVKDISLEGYAPTISAPLAIQGIPIEGAGLPVGTMAGDRIVVTGHITDNGAIAASAITKVRTVVTINKASGSLRPAAMRPEMRQRPDRTAPPMRPPIDRPQSFEAVRPDVRPERPQVERPSGNIPVS